ncbi:hypothetical protein Q5752_006161 [Cryptotrichosporon argae]
MTEVTAIVAATLSNGIGLNGGLPWRLPGEMKYFARVTTGAPPPGTHNAVVMGRKTWDGIPPKFRPLKDRLNLVVSRAGVDISAPLSTCHPSFDAALSSLSPAATHRVFLIGGAQLYNALVPTAAVRRVLLTRVLADVPCDTFLVDFAADLAWARASHAALVDWVGFDVDEEHEEKGIRYCYEMWERR